MLDPAPVGLIRTRPPTSGLVSQTGQATREADRPCSPLSLASTHTAGPGSQGSILSDAPGSGLGKRIAVPPTRFVREPEPVAHDSGGVGRPSSGDRWLRWSMPSTGYRLS